MSVNIVVVGGGAGGLELATKLGKKLGKSQRANITLVDKNRTHLWKPLLHEVATGSLDSGIDALSYRAHAAKNGFSFQLGEVQGIDTQAQQLQLGAMLSEGKEVLPARSLDYDYLVMAIGSVSNDFNTPGVSEHCIFLDNPQRAELFHRRMLNRFLQFSQSSEAEQGGKVKVAIVGAGATGVELSAELYNAVDQLVAYGVPKVNSQRLAVSLIEAGAQILPALPSSISSSAHKELESMGVNVRTSTMVTEANERGLQTKQGEFIEADIMVWAAGIRCPAFMHEIGGLETNRINQLVVKPSLQTTRAENIYAIGDCAACSTEQGLVPPRAQSAHQMASHVYRNLLRQINAKPLSDFRYRDYGSLVSLSRYSTVGSLMGNLTRGSMKVEGRFARLMYLSLYRMHHVAIHGPIRTALMMLVGRINQIIRPSMKLH